MTSPFVITTPEALAWAWGLDGPCLVCGAYEGDHDEGCMLDRSVR